MKRRAAILFEGSSSATGLFDEQRQGGFAGRIVSHYDAYNEMTCLGIKQDPHWVFTHRHSQPDLQPAEIADSLGGHVREIHRRSVHTLLGIFVIGIQSDYDVYRFGEQKALNSWINGISQLGDTIASHRIEPLFMTSPRYSITTPLGIPAVHNPELHKTYLSYLKGLAYGLEAPLLSFEQAMGGTLAEFGAMDRRHVTASGHEAVANFLLPILDSKLNISNNPVAEEQLKAFALKTSAEIF